MWWISERIRRWDLGLSIFMIILTILTLLYFHRLDSYQEEIKEIPVGSWWCHIDTPHGWIEQSDHKKNKNPPMANRPKPNPSKTPRTK